MELSEISLIGVDSIIVLASYKEAPNLERLISAVGPNLVQSDLIIIADDSGVNYRRLLEETCEKAMSNSQARICFSYVEVKDGRGSAIRRAFKFVFANSTSVHNFVEADSDGSHRPDDIIRILRSESRADLLIGSRYSPGSKISGWPLARRIFSRALNFAIPKILAVPSSDLTNGLRKYGRSAVEIMLGFEAKNKGFIFLSESAYHISQAKLQIEDIPIHFENRVFGESTVGASELLNSLSGLIALIWMRIRKIVRF